MVAVERRFTPGVPADIHNEVLGLDGERAALEGGLQAVLEGGGDLRNIPRVDQSTAVDSRLGTIAKPQCSRVAVIFVGDGRPQVQQAVLANPRRIHQSPGDPHRHIAVLGGADTASIGHRLNTGSALEPLIPDPESP